MLSNKFIIWASVIILSLPFWALTGRLVVLNSSNDQLDCNTFNETFETHDNISEVQQLPLLIISSRLSQERHLVPATLGRYGTLIRGHRSLTPEWIGECFARLVGYYQPKHLVITLDNTILEQSDSRLLTALDFIIQERKRYQLNMMLSVVGVLKTPATKALGETIDARNKAIEDWASERADARFVDPNPRFSDLYRQPKAAFFWPDGQTLTGPGTQILFAVLTQEIDAIRVEQ